MLWRRVNDATFQTLTGKCIGQYDIRLTKNPDVAGFFSALPTYDATSLGGYPVDAPIEPFVGPNPVPASILKVRFMGEGSERRDWYIRAQRPDSAYPLWRPGRAFPSNYEPQGTDRKFIIVARDVNGRFHARWINEAEFAHLPERLRGQMESEDVGIIETSKTSTNPILQEVLVRLERSYNVLLYGPPATGKTHLLKEVSRMFSATQYAIDTDSETDPIKVTEA